MIGRILFLSAAAFLAYRYIARSNKKAEELRALAGGQEVLPAAHEALPSDKEPVSHTSNAIEAGKPARTLASSSSAAETPR